jgi:hypothetical protein
MSQTGVYSTSGGGGGGTGILYLQGDNSQQAGADASNTVYVQGEAPLYTFADPLTFQLRIGKTSNYAWQVVTNQASPIQMTTGEAYITKGATAVALALPPSANVGDTYKIVGYGNLWSIAQNAGQKIVLGNIQTTAGVTGSVQATMITDQLEIVCVTANTEFYAIQVQGNPSFN